MTVGVVVLPYIIPMLLGRTFDMFTSQVGVDIFPQKSIENPIVIERSFVHSDFRVIRNDSEARHFLGVTDDLSLRVKAGVLHIAATGDYLKDVQTRENYVEILVKSQDKWEGEGLFYQESPSVYWENVPYSAYVGPRSPGFSTFDGQVDHRPGEVKVRQEYHSFEDKLKRMVYAAEEKMGNDLGIRIKYYSTVTAPYVPQDIDSFLKLLEDFPAQAEKLNGGRGVPLKVELVPLHELSARMIALRPNKYLEKTLEDMDDKFSDLLVTHAAIRSISEKTKPKDYKENCEVHDYGSDIHGKLDVFKDVIRRLDTASPSALFETKRALQAYEQKEEPDDKWGYYKKLKHIKEDVEHTEELTGGAHSKNKVSSKSHAEQNGQQLHVVPVSGSSRGATSHSNGGGSNLMSSNFTPLDHFGYLAEMSMANGVCASLNKFSGSFLTLRRNCTISGVTCSRMCWALQEHVTPPLGNGAPGPRVTRQGGECVGVVVAELHVSQDVAVGARTINLGRNACDRAHCYHEYCCCRMGGRIGIL
ncbi:uncharacterized protein LOC101856893 [Aplysia californica]|uniref:Uncharacterized protein LOC101856893 n=1 Tax=Aplysia californica TaxID=6500 RepID=A0ABM1VT67_APLCA|nr:uncharacterized protein LOC101856893 [Aplysia californica]